LSHPDFKKFLGKIIKSNQKIFRMKDENIKIYGYRWIILVSFMLVIIVNQLLWITFAAITIDATKFYGVTDLMIGMLSMVFMIVYIFVSIPASWVIDKYGFRVAVGIGAGLTAIFGLLRGLMASDYTMVLVAQIGIAIGQPFILNSITKVASRWFPMQERGMASGLASLAMYLGIFLGISLTPFIFISGGMNGMLISYGFVALIAGIIFLMSVKEHPPTPASHLEQDKQVFAFGGIRQSLRSKDFILLLFIFFIGLGVFNSVTTWIEDILRPRGFTITQAGITGGLMIIGGIVGALILPTISDRNGRRVPFVVTALAAASLGLIGITYFTSYALLLTSSFIMGFFLLSAAPIGFQYAAEVTYPVPESTSNGLLLLVGQVSGIIFIFGMDSLKSPATGSMTLSLWILAALMLISVLLSFGLKESSLLKK
jgi:MFS family permease